MQQNDFLDQDFLQKLEQISLLSRKVFHGLLKGERRSKKKGVSIEFADYRDYVPGDDLRFLDWNIYGRLERLFIKLFQEEEDLNVFFLVDSSESMNFGTPSKWIYAKKLVAALSYVALMGLDRISVAAFAGNVHDHLPLMRGKHAVWRLFEFLRNLDIHSQEPTNLEQACRTFAMQSKSSGMIILLSDFMDPGGYEEGLKFFASRNHDVLAIQILSPEEIQPTLVGDIRLVDCETASTVDLSISAHLLTRYDHILHGYLQQLKDWCVRHDIFYLFTSTEQSFEDLVLKYLRNLGMVH